MGRFNALACPLGLRFELRECIAEMIPGTSITWVGLSDCFKIGRRLLKLTAILQDDAQAVICVGVIEILGQNES